MISLTAFYFVTPEQRFVDHRCISKLHGTYVAFNIQKVNPFNQMLDRDPRLSDMLYRQNCHSSSKSSLTQSKSDKFGLTLANIQLHENQVQKSANKFMPKMNRLI